MSFFRYTVSFLLMIAAIIVSPVASSQEHCVVKGETLSQAHSIYARQCTLERIDCDPFDGEWYCASFTITTTTPPALTINTPPVVSRHPPCVMASSDSDGDGYGWENHTTCLVTDSSVTGPQAPSPIARPICESADSDSDGDGFGWENFRTCLVADNSADAPTQDSSQPASDNEDSAPPVPAPVVTPSPVTPSPVTPEEPIVVIPQSEPATGSVIGAVTASAITDLVLVTGQSNTLGAGSTYDPVPDAPNDRVFAFTDQGWQVANLNQVWDLDWHPRNHPETDPSNNFSLHYGKSVATADSSRVVGFILASSPGSKIEVWNLGSPFYNEVQNKVLDALNQLPHKDAIDGILWHQGESDGQDIPSYTVSLNALISNLRSEQWVDDQAPFICGETKIASVNRRLNLLNEDEDPNTACVAGIDLSTRDGTHFDAPALRILGARYADAWLDITR